MRTSCLQSISLIAAAGLCYGESWSGVSYSDWAAAKLFGQFGYDASIYGDPDGDGAVNFVEYARGTDPNVADAQSLESLSPGRGTGGNTSEFKFQHMPSLVEIAWSYELSNNLTTWRNAAGESSNTTSMVGDLELVTLSVPDPLAGPPDALFGRLRWHWKGSTQGDKVAGFTYGAGSTSASGQASNWLNISNYDASRIGNIGSITSLPQTITLGSMGLPNTDVSAAVPVTTWVRSDSPAEDKEDYQVFVGSLSSGHDLRGLLAFDLSSIPDTAAISQATVSLYQSGNSTGNNDNEPSQQVGIELFSMTGSYTNNATWNSAASLFSTSLASTSGDPSVTTAGVEHQFSSAALTANLQNALTTDTAYLGIASPDLESQSIRHFFAFDGASANNPSASGGAIGPSLSVTYQDTVANNGVVEVPASTTTASLSDAISNGDYHEFQITANSSGGHIMGLSFDHMGTSTTADFSSSIAVFASSNGFATAPDAQDALHISTANITTAHHQTDIISSVQASFGVENITGTVTVRLYFYDDSSHAASITRLDNLCLHGFQPEDRVAITTPNYSIHVSDPGFRVSVIRPNNTALPADSTKGLSFLGSNAVSSEIISQTSQSTTFRVTNGNGQTALAEFLTNQHHFSVNVSLENSLSGNISLRTGSPGPAYGLADRGGWETNANLASQQKTFPMSHNGHAHRFISSFLIFPQQGIAGVSFDRGNGSVSIGPNYYQMSNNSASQQKFYFFAGSMAEIYSAYRDVRITEGYPGVAPKMDGFELGWESWDLLRWNTNASSCQNAIQGFINRGYDIRWAVTGSGFWQNQGTTVSFGLYDFAKYPDNVGANPPDFGDWASANNIRWMIGQRTNFVQLGGPHSSNPGESGASVFDTSPNSQEGVDNNYFLTQSNSSLVTLTSTVFPTVPCYLLDGNVPGASAWFKNLYDDWGVDGVKEDTMMSTPDHTIYNGPMRAIAASGDLVMARCAAYSSPGTLSRVNDTGGASSMTLRCPINYLQYAASAAPNAYSDTVGFGGMNNVTASLRHGWLLSLTAGMAVSDSPWNRGWSSSNEAKFKKIADFHYQYGPYMHSAAVDSHATGYPHTMTPLPIAFPDDENTYNLASSSSRQFQWMIGPSLLATPLLHQNYSSTSSMNVYLPAGKWIDYETGQAYQGPTTLSGFSMPTGKTPVFVGGKGILVRRNVGSNTLKGVVFPIANNGTQHTFTHPDGIGKSTVTNNNIGWNSAALTVTDSQTGNSVSFQTDPTTGAISFDLLPGHNYTLSGGQ